MATTIQPQTEDELADQVRSGGSLRLVGAATKPTLSRCPDSWTKVDLRGLTGITEYAPTEFTISARAGTPLAEICETLAQNKQFLPFDPPLIEQGATIGGTLAAGLSGSGQLRFGSIRDYVLHLRMVDGLGTIVFAGGKVVKNAAGFDIPKLMVGSLGRLGAITEVTLKVFPDPPVRRSMEIETQDFESALSLQNSLAGSPLGIEAIDLAPPNRLWLRIAGTEKATANLAARIEKIVNESDAKTLNREDESEAWRPFRTRSVGEDSTARIIKVPVWPRVLPDLERSLHEQRVTRRYCAAGNLAWIRWPENQPISRMEATLDHIGLAGLVVTGESPRIRLGQARHNVFADKIKAAMDPNDLFGSID